MTFDKQIRVVAVAAEVILVLGVDLLIFYHYYTQASGLSVVSSVGVVLTSLVACAALHSLVTRFTALVKGFSFGIWLTLTIVMAMAGASVWMALKYQHETDQQTATVRENKKDEIKATSDAELQKLKTVAALADQMKNRGAANRLITNATSPNKGLSLPTAAAATETAAAPVVIADRFEKGSIFGWFYSTGVHTLPLLLGILGLALWLAVTVYARQAEIEAERQFIAQWEGNVQAAPLNFSVSNPSSTGQRRTSPTTPGFIPAAASTTAQSNQPGSANPNP